MSVVAGEALTPRELAVLVAVERRLSNAEIAQEHHISVRTVESHIAALRRKLGVDTRAGLISAARERRGSSVPVPDDSFVGRDADLAAVRRLLERSRCVTVIGPAGVGKTRLALELAAADVRVPVVVDLAHTAPLAVPAVVAKAVGLLADGNEAAVAVALSAQPYLLLLDNCDRVGPAVAALLRGLLAAAPSLRVLATSQSPVGGPAEALYELLPLPVDDTDGAAVTLFLERARASAPPGSHADPPGEVVADICRRLDGLPLAIELAAARVRHLSVPELATRLSAGTETLDRVGADSRHRTLEAAFDWTWDLLDTDEQWVLTRLAALPRTFDLELAEAVTRPGSTGTVLRLVDRSLVSPVLPAATPRRFRLLEPVRELALTRIDTTEADEVRRAHAVFHAAAATEVRRRARTDDSRAAAARAKLLCPEVNAAAAWALAHEPELVLPLVTGLAVGGEQYGADAVSLESIGRAARDQRIRALATSEDLDDLGMALCYTDLALVDELAAVASARAADPYSWLIAHHLAGYADAYGGRESSALGHLDEAERLADELLEPWKLASVRQGRGIALRGLGDLGGALAAFEAAMNAYALAGDALHVNNARYMMASVAVEDPAAHERVLAWTDQCVAYGRDTGNEHELAHALLVRARVPSNPRAATDLHEAVDRFRSVGDLRCLTRGHLLLAEGRPPAEAVPLLEQALDHAVRAHDTKHQATALERLVDAYWAAGEHRRAAVALGRLTVVAGDAAIARAPSPLRSALEDWGPAVAEGRARGLAAQPASAPGSR